MGKKIKVIWICYFSNEEVQNYIKPLKRSKEYAPWIKNLIPLFENSDEIDLHIIAPHRWLVKNKYFEKDGIKYHFIRSGMPFIGRQWPKIFKFDFWTDFFWWKINVKSNVSKIDPDIIHLHGAENEFSSVAIQFKDKYPILVTLQGFLHKIVPNSKEPRVKRRIKRELYIYRNFKHFGYRTETMKNVLKEINPEAKMHFYNNPQSVTSIREPSEKKPYDMVYFARVTKNKGIEDLLKAIVLIKKEIPDLKVLIIGNANQKYLKELKQFCKENNIERNIRWVGFLPSQDEVFKEASKAKISVLPTYYDMIPGTIIQSMFLKLPVVAYNTGSIPELNRNDEIVSLVNLHNIEELSKSIINLLKNRTYRIKKAEQAYKKAYEMYNNNIIKEDILKAYRTIIKSEKIKK